MMQDDDELYSSRVLNIPSSASFVGDTRMDSTIDRSNTYNYDDASYAYSDSMIGDNSIMNQIPVFTNYGQSDVNESSVRSSFMRFYEESNYAYDDLDNNTVKRSHAEVPSVSFNTPTRDTNDGEDGNQEDDEKSCVPSWMKNASTSLKIVILFSTALLIGCLALISIASTVPISESATVQGSTGGAIYITFAPTPFPKIMDVPTGVAPTIAVPVPPTKEPAYIPVLTMSPTGKSAMQDENEGLTRQPTNHPIVLTVAPTKTPSRKPVSNTDQPTLSPTIAARKPTLGPTSVPTIRSSLAPSIQTLEPTHVPTIHSSASPTFQTMAPSLSPDIVSFYASSRYRNPELAAKVGMLPFDSVDFLIHLGNWNSAVPGVCKEYAYSRIALMYHNSTVPVLFVPGYNEWNRCADTDNSELLWRNYFVGSEDNYEHELDVIRQKDRKENFAFVHRDVLFLGLNMVSGPDDSFLIRLEDNSKWMEDNMAKFSKNVKVVVIFGNAGPWGVNAPFSNTLSTLIQKYTAIHPVLTFVYVKESLEDVSLMNAVLGLENFSIVNVKAKEWPPLKMSIDVNHHIVSWE